MALPLTPHPDYPPAYRPVRMQPPQNAYAAALPVILLTPPDHPQQLKHHHHHLSQTMPNGRLHVPPTASHRTGASSAAHGPPAHYIYTAAGQPNPLMAYRGPFPHASSFNSPVSPPSHPPAQPHPAADDSPLVVHPRPAVHDLFAQQRVHAVTSGMQQMVVSQPTSSVMNPRRLAEYAASEKPTFWDSPYPDKASKDNTSLAHNTCSMMCYIWYSDSIGPHSMAGAEQTLPRDEITVIEEDARSRLQFTPTRDFVTFMQGVLSTTQLSRSVVVLALHYIYRLKQESPVLALTGSETRLAVTALMMANKFVDDNTYTNKTWSEVSHIPLDEINKSETEFLGGIKYQLHVSGAMYDAWLKLLKGLAIAKEEEQTSYVRKRSVLRSRHRLQQPQRARSTSPLASRTLYTHPHPPTSSHGYLPATASDSYMSSPVSASSPMRIKQESPSPPRTKRRVEDAFSPEYVHHAIPPPKRGVTTPAGSSGRSSSRGRFDPPVDLPHLVIPSRPSSSRSAPSHQQQQQASASASSSRPLSTAMPAGPFTYSVPLQPVPPAAPPVAPSRPAARHVQPGLGFNRPPSTVDTLAAPYQLHNRLPNFNEPHDLYYYSLAASPLDVPDSQKPPRKAVLRYHHPAYFHNPPTSSSSSRPVLPPPQALTQDRRESLELPPLQIPPDMDGGVASRRPSIFNRAGAQMAPFANAGSPGVQWTGESFPWNQQQQQPPS